MLFVGRSITDLYGSSSGPTPEELEEMERKATEERLKREAQEQEERERKEAEEAAERARRQEEWVKRLSFSIHSYASVIIALVPIGGVARLVLKFVLIECPQICPHRVLDTLEMPLVVYRFIGYGI